MEEVLHPPPPGNANNAPNIGADATFAFSEDTEAAFSIGAPIWNSLTINTLYLQEAYC